MTDIEKWFDAVMGQEEAILTHEDVALLFTSPVEDNKGYVYYDDTTRLIKGVSLNFDPETAASCPYVAIDAALALAFMEGRESLSSWLVSYWDTEPRLVKNDSIVISPAGDEWFPASSEVQHAPITIVAITPKGEKTGTLLVRLEGLLSVKVEKHRQMTLLFSPKGMPDTLVRKFDIDLEELFTEGAIELDFNDEIDSELVMMVRPFHMMSFQHIGQYDTNKPLPLPKGRFDDLRMFKEVGSLPNEGLVAELFDGLLTVSIRGSGGARYDRNLTALMVVVCEKNNKDALLHVERVPLDRLNEGPVEIPVSFEENVSVMTQLYYKNCFFIDHR